MPPKKINKKRRGELEEFKQQEDEQYQKGEGERWQIRNIDFNVLPQMQNIEIEQQAHQPRKRDQKISIFPPGVFTQQKQISEVLVEKLDPRLQQIIKNPGQRALHVPNILNEDELLPDQCTEINYYNRIKSVVDNRSRGTEQFNKFAVNKEEFRNEIREKYEDLKQINMQTANVKAGDFNLIQALQMMDLAQANEQTLLDFVNYKDKLDQDKISSFLAYAIYNSVNFRRQYFSNISVDEGFFKLFFHSDSIRNFIDRNYERNQFYDLRIHDYTTDTLRQSIINEPNNGLDEDNIFFDGPPQQNIVASEVDIFKFFYRVIFNVSQISMSVLYKEYLTLTQTGTTPDAPFTDEQPTDIVQGLYPFSSYIENGQAMERFAGRLATSKGLAALVLVQIFKIIAVLNADPQKRFQNNIIQRIFCLQPYLDLLKGENKRVKSSFFSTLPLFMAFLVAHKISLIYQSSVYGQDIKNVFSNLTLETNAFTVPAEVVQNVLKTKAFFFTDVFEKNVYYQALDISNLFQFRSDVVWEAKPNDIDYKDEFMNYFGEEADENDSFHLLDYKINLMTFSGLARGLQAHFNGVKKLYYITFIMKFPILYIPDSEPFKGMEDRFDLQNKQKAPSNTNFMFKTGRFRLNHTEVNSIIEALNSNDPDKQLVYDALFKVRKVIIEIATEQLEEYGDDLEWDLSRIQIIQYQIYSIPIEYVDKILDGKNQSVYKMGKNKQIDEEPPEEQEPQEPEQQEEEPEQQEEEYEQMHDIESNPSITERSEYNNKQAVINERFYSKLTDYPDFDEINCVDQVFGYIFIKELDAKIVFSRDTLFQFYFNSDFYKENIKLLVSQNLVQSLKIFWEKVTKLINVFMFQTQSLLGVEHEKIKYRIFTASSHVWLNKKRYNPSLNQLMNSTFKLKLNDSKKQKNTLERSYIFYDIETMSVPVQKERKSTRKIVSGDQQQPVLLCYELDRKPAYILAEDCCLQFVQFLYDVYVKSFDGVNKQIKQTFVLAHNGNKFDHLFLFPILLKFFGSKVDFGGSSVDLTYLQIQDVIIFVDTCDLIPGKLKNLAKDFQVEHRKKEFDVTKITKENMKDKAFVEKLIEYCQFDVKVMREIYEKFVQTVQAIIPQAKESDVKRTLPSTSLNLFRKYLLPKNVNQIYGNFHDLKGIKVQNYERKSYHGGLCQVWNYQEVEEGSHYFDFVSMYVSILSIDNDFPISQGTYQAVNQRITGAGQIQKTRLYILKQFKFDKDSKMPNLPVKDIKTKITLYVKEWASDEKIPFLVFWGHEISLAFQELGLKEIQIEGVISYSQRGNIFKDYMTLFFNEKKRFKDGPRRAIAKLFGNSLYGKLGQQNLGQRKIMSHDEVQQVGLQGLEQQFEGRKELIQKFQEGSSDQLISFIRKLDKNFVEVQFEPNPLRTNYCGSLIRIASYVTMIGRSWLFKLLNSIGYENIYYCDTDSCVFKQKGLEGLKKVQKIGSERGDIASQFDASIKIIGGRFIAPKCYYLDLDKEYNGSKLYLRCKGIIQPSKEKLIELSQTGQTQFQQKKWERNYGGISILDEIKLLTIKPKRHKNINGLTLPFNNINDFI